MSFNFTNKLAELGFATYAEYLGGEHWRDFKMRYKEAPDLPQTCLVCQSERVCLHHITYLRLGEEELTDVLPLCEYHHTKVHEFLKVNNRPLWETRKAIKALKEGLSIPQKRSKVATKEVVVDKCIFCPDKAHEDGLCLYCSARLSIVRKSLDPSGKVVVTLALIELGSIRGSLKRAQLDIIGADNSRKGWKLRAVGTLLTKRDANRFLQVGSKRRKKVVFID